MKRWTWWLPSLQLEQHLFLPAAAVVLGIVAELLDDPGHGAAQLVKAEVQLIRK